MDKSNAIAHAIVFSVVIVITMPPVICVSSDRSSAVFFLHNSAHARLKKQPKSRSRVTSGNVHIHHLLVKVNSQAALESSPRD